MLPEEEKILKEALQFGEWLKGQYDVCKSKNEALEREILLLKTEVSQLKQRSASVSASVNTVSRKSSMSNPNTDPELLKRTSMQQSLAYQRDMAMMRDTINRQEAELKQYHDLVYLFKQPQMPFDIKVVKKDKKHVSETRQWLKNTFGYVDAKKYSCRKSENELLWHAYRSLVNEHVKLLQVSEDKKAVVQEQLLANVFHVKSSKQTIDRSTQFEQILKGLNTRNQAVGTDPIDLETIDRVQYLKDQIKKLGVDEWTAFHDSTLYWTKDFRPVPSHSVSTQVEVGTYSVSVSTDSSESFSTTTQTEQQIEPSRCDSETQVSCANVDSNCQTDSISDDIKTVQIFEGAAEPESFHADIPASIAKDQIVFEACELPPPLKPSSAGKNSVISLEFDRNYSDNIGCDSPLSLVSFETKRFSTLSDQDYVQKELTPELNIEDSTHMYDQESCAVKYNRNVSIVDSAIGIEVESPLSNTKDILESLNNENTSEDFDWDYDPIADQFVQVPKKNSSSSKNVDHFINTWNSSVRSW